MAITPEKLAAKDNEHAHQTAFFCWLARNAIHEPRLRLMFAIPNGGERNGLVAANMVAEGVKSGVPDTCLPVPSAEMVGKEYPIKVYYHGLYIEFKQPSEKLKSHATRGPWDKGGVKPNQKEWLSDLTAQGYKCVVCYSWKEAAAEVFFYLTGMEWVYVPTQE